MRKLVIFLLVAGFTSFSSFVIKAEDDEDMTIHGNWAFSGTVTAAGSLNYYKNWQGGDSDNSSFNLNMDLLAKYTNGKHSWNNSIKLEYGISKLKGENARVNGKDLVLETIYNYNFTDRIALYFRLKGDSPFAKGYIYYDDPVDVVFSDDRLPRYGEKRVLVSDPFDPVNLEQGLGMAFKVYNNPTIERSLTLSTGLAGRQLISSDYYIEDDLEETDTIEYTKIDDYADIGWEAIADLVLTLNKSAQFKSSATAFYGFDKQLWKCNWESVLSIGISKYFGVSITGTMLYDEEVFKDPQWKTNTLLTLSYKLF